MRALVTGATGFLGRHLVRRLERPTVLSRIPDRARRTLGDAVRVVAWEPDAGPPPAEAFEGVEAVFHLAGEPIAAGRWTAERKSRIRRSRVEGTRHLVQALEALPRRPKVLVSGSAVGYYGDRGDEVLDETAGPGSDFLAQLCRDWESEALRARELGMRVVVSRTGIVLDRKGGALPRMLPPFRLGLGGRLGSGRQWMPWIHRDDLIELFAFAAQGTQVDGPMNAAAPNPATNAEFTRALGTVLRRPTVFAVPAVALQLGFGEMSQVLLGSQRAAPRVAERAGFRFRHPSLVDALRDVLARPRADAAPTPNPSLSR